MRGLIGDAPVLDVLSLAYGNALDQLRKENVPSISQFSAVSIPTHSEPEPENCEPESLAQDLPKPQDDYDSISDDEDESIFNETFLIDENDLKDEKTQYGTRKRLKRILEPTELHQETLKAEKEEKERVRRLEDKAELHTQLGFLVEEQPLVDQQPQPLILDIDPVTREILVQVDVSITRHLKAHQLDGLRFLYNSTVESVDRLKMNGESRSDGSGCILAHKMGLGKTFQVIVFLHTIWNNRHLNSHLNRILIIVPYSVLPNWCFEFTKWTNICGIQNQVLVFQNFNETPVNQRPAYLETWYRNGGILLVTIRLFQTLVSPRTKNLSIHPTFKKTLLNPGPDLLVIDEGHLLKNLNSAFHRSVCLVTTRRRIILTGTPLQNNLSEYYTMVSTVKPGLLGARAEFANRFEAPILNGQYANSTPYDVKLMSQRAHVLNRLLRETIHRVDERHGDVDHCCSKTEYVLHLRLSPTQDTLYRYFLEHLADKSGSRGALLYERTILGLVFAHPELLKSFYQRNTNRPLALTANEGNAWFEAFLPDTTTCSLDSRIRLSAKFTLAFAILQQVEALSEKLVIFSKEASTLCLFEFFLQSKNAEIYQASEWIPGTDYARIDGTVDAKERAQMIEQFNDSTNKRARLLLVSNRSGGIGISLVGASRCILLDVNWNPSTDQQAVYRLCRYGQKRPVVVYRFAAWGKGNWNAEYLEFGLILAFSLNQTQLKAQCTIVRFSNNHWRIE